MVQNKVNILYIHCSEQANEWSKPGLAYIAANCSAPVSRFNQNFTW